MIAIEHVLNTLLVLTVLSAIFSISVVLFDVFCREDGVIGRENEDPEVILKGYSEEREVFKDCAVAQFAKTVSVYTAHLGLFLLQATGLILWSQMYLGRKHGYNLKTLLANEVEELEDCLRTIIGGDTRNS